MRSTAGLFLVAVALLAGSLPLQAADPAPAAGSPNLAEPAAPAEIAAPLEELFEGGVSESDGSIDPVGSLARGAVWVAARSDSTEDLEPSAIFGPAARPEPALGEDEGPEF